MRKKWSFRQRFSVRAGTMLLLFCLGLAGLALVDPLYEALVAVFPLAGDLF